jgi:signal transduction histidine kinase
MALNERTKGNLTRALIAGIVVVIVAIYYYSEIRPFAYRNYETNLNQLQRYDAELNEALVQIRFGIKKYYNPIDKAQDGVQETLAALKKELAEKPNKDIQKNLVTLEDAIKSKEILTTKFKRLNPILINAIYQFSTIMAEIIETQASTQVVESSNLQDQYAQLFNAQFMDKLNNLFRGILIYINQRNEDRQKYLISLVQEINKSMLEIKADPKKYATLDVDMDRLAQGLAYATKILEVQPEISKIDESFFEVPIVPTLNTLSIAYKHAFDNYRTASYTYRIVLYILVFGLLLIVRWAFRRLAEINRQLEQRVADRTKELTIKNADLNEALGDLKEAQDQLIMQEKMASVGMLTTGIAHEIKNPLNFVNNFSDLSIELVDELTEELALHKDKVDSKSLGMIEDILEDLKTNCAKIKEHGTRADNIVKNMLMHSQESGVQKEMIDVKALLDENYQIALESFRGTQGKLDVILDKHFPEGTVSILAVPQAIGRVFIYLIDNALYALKEKKLVAPPEFQPTLLLSIQQVDENVIIRIKDNGTGIPKKNVDKVFEPFFTTKPTGKGNTGLGLSICYDTVVKQHKGELRVSSEEGSFTEFTVILPINARAKS